MSGVMRSLQNGLLYRCVCVKLLCLSHSVDVYRPPPRSHLLALRHLLAMLLQN